MNRRAWIGLILMLIIIAPSFVAQAQNLEPTAGPEVVIITHHPYPDDADPLGIPFGADCSVVCDAFVVRHGATSPFADGIAFPGFIVDGQVAMESLPGDGTFDATMQAYDDAVAERLAAETPVAMRIASRVVESEVRITFWSTTSSPVGDGLVAWIALVEDPVHYTPPPALSNGVNEHPFTLRSIDRIGAINLTATETRRDIVLPIDDDWDVDAIRVAAWIEQDRSALGTFEPGEVLQAVSHPIAATFVTEQVDRAVLVEAYSASWCQPCLIGDEALEELADAYGLPTGRALDDRDPSYLRSPDLPIALVIAAAILVGALFAFSRLETP